MLVEPGDDPRYRQVTLTYAVPDGQSQLADVFVRFATIDENVRRDGDLSPYLMARDGDGTWRLTLRLRADFRLPYQFCASPTPLGCRQFSDEQWRELVGGGTADPGNPLTCSAMYANDGPSSLLELPAALPQPWTATRPGAWPGRITEHEVASTVLGNTRRVWIYTPAGRPDGAADMPLVVLLDGGDWVETGVQASFDNLIADAAIPPSVVVLVDTPDHTRYTELPNHGRFQRFLLDELLPWVGGQVQTTPDPSRTVIAGQSLGGLMAAYAGLHAPHRFGRVLCQSGSFQWPKGSEFDTAAGAVISQYVAAARAPIAIFQDVGLVEVLLLGRNRHMRDVLLAKGYPLTYREYYGGHHYANWRGGLADGLITLLNHPPT